ncbi:hypothetical protein OUZ56_005080 [Daphnia magna]|uniref:Uncharacterized protein n=1 Tax=Daphnia magna TaxID=35525 RepID=A0ABQ9YRV2_9CRUS|nr:hypothetical protein OUZ56_005080 [Daphnia magna]
MASSSSFSEDMFIIHPVTARRVLRKRKRQCTGYKPQCVYIISFLMRPSTFALDDSVNIIAPRTDHIKCDTLLCLHVEICFDVLHSTWKRSPHQSFLEGPSLLWSKMNISKDADEEIWIFLFVPHPHRF